MRQECEEAKTIEYPKGEWHHHWLSGASRVLITSQLQGGMIQRSDHEIHWLRQAVGQEVVVAVSTKGIIRNGFHTQMSLKGGAQVHPEDSDAFRVVLDKDNFAYFRTEDVMLVNPLTKDALTINVNMDLVEEEHE